MKAKDIKTIAIGAETITGWNKIREICSMKGDIPSYDWNEIIDLGVYTTNASAYNRGEYLNAPNAYFYGMLLVFRNNLGNFSRIIQLYIPDYNISGHTETYVSPRMRTMWLNGGNSSNPITATDWNIISYGDLQNYVTKEELDTALNDIRNNNTMQLIDNQQLGGGATQKDS